MAILFQHTSSTKVFSSIFWKFLIHTQKSENAKITLLRMCKTS